MVTATRVEQDSFDLPMSIDKVAQKDITDAQLRMTLSESLIRIPGITAQNRNQMAQDPQISSRGFGARSQFGVRGIRIYVDGIPLTMPDGIGNPGSVDMEMIDGIEVMRGPFSAMYGNSSGGVIQMLTKKAPASPEVSADVLYGSFGTQRESVQAAGTTNGVEYITNYSNFASDGYRANSASEKRQATVKLAIKPSEDSKLTALINWFDQNAQDPGGLRRADLTKPTSAASTSLSAKAQVTRDNLQTGLNFEKQIDANNTLNLVTYVGERNNLQILPSGVYPGYNGRASSISRTFYGAEARLTNRGTLIERPYQLTFGLNAGKMDDDRTDRSSNNGVIDQSTTRINQAQSTQNFDQFAQGLWSFAERWDLHAGVRYTSLDLKIVDRIGTNNGNMSFSRTLPVAGLVFKASPTVNLYANIGRGFETPTMVEVTYANATTGAGPNTGMKPSTSTNMEVGAKWMISEDTSTNLAVFNIETENEIVINVANSTTGYTSYRNAGKTTRNGAELSGLTKLGAGFAAYGAYTLLEATYDRDSNFNAGKYIPGTYRSQLYAELTWSHQPSNFRIALEGRYNSKVFVNDTNSDSVSSYTIANLRATLQQQFGAWRITEYARIDNLFDKEYIGSVRVNDSNSRFFETAPGRNYIVGIKANYMF